MVFTKIPTLEQFKKHLRYDEEHAYTHYVFTKEHEARGSRHEEYH